jgi:RNA polymerase sigma-70 factor (ECF subfamily)
MKADDATLARLMARAQQGDRQAYRLVLEASRDWLRRYLARRIAPAAIDDLVQEVLIAVHTKRATFDPARPFLPWLAAIARYRWVDALRRGYRVAEETLAQEPAGEAEAEELAARISLDRLFAMLPPGQVAAIRAVKIDGLSIGEAAQRCGQSESLVKVNIHRGLRRLAALVESE